MKADIIIEQDGSARIGTPIDHDTNLCISDFLSYKIDAARFVTGCGNWDGTKKLYKTKHQTFPVGLINKLVQFGQEHLDIEFNLVNQRRVTPSVYAYPQIRNFMPYDFQGEAIESVLKHMQDSLIKRGILVIPTAGGKTVMAGFLIKRLCTPSLFLVRNRLLLYQAIDTFNEMFGEKHVGQLGDGVVNIKPITVATVQTLCAITGITYTKDTEPEEEIYDTKKESVIKRQEDIKKAVDSLGKYGLVICDEVHGVTSTTAYALINYLQPTAKFILGLTATPNKESGDKLLLEAAMGGVIYRIRPEYLMSIGYLAPFVSRFKIMPLYPERRYNSNQYDLAFNELIANNCNVNDYVVKLAMQRMDQHRRVFVATRFIEQSMNLSARIPNSVFIYGKTSKDMRDKAIDSFKNNEVKCIVATIKLMGEGVDIRCISSIINASAMRSGTATIQLIGRGLRTDKNTNKINLIYDDMIHEGVGFFERAADHRVRTIKAEYGEDKIVQV
jgi:superfamily II DNA or RNA helicase